MVKSAPVLTALVIAYPFVNHLGATFAAPALGLLWLGLLLLASFWLGSRSPVFLALALTSLAAAVLGQFQGNADLFARVPPVMICFSLAWVFGRTLLPGRTALIILVGQRARGELAEPVARYGYRLTVVWTSFFVLMGLECVLLGLFASPLWWSVFTNFVNYLLIGLLFVVEYPIRLIILRGYEHAPFLVSVRESLRLDLR